MVTHSLKKMKQEDRDIALNPMQFRKAGSADFIDIRTLDETNEEVFNSIYYKEVPIVTGGLDETLIVTYSLKYKAYQQKIRSRQIKRAEKIINSPCKYSILLFVFLNKSKTVKFRNLTCFIR